MLWFDNEHDTGMGTYLVCRVVVEMFLNQQHSQKTEILFHLDVFDGGHLLQSVCARLHPRQWRHLPCDKPEGFTPDRPVLQLALPLLNHPWQMIVLFLNLFCPEIVSCIEPASVLFETVSYWKIKHPMTRPVL